MAASFPSSIKSFTSKTDNVDDVAASHVNDLQDEVVAVETALGTAIASKLIRGWACIDGDASPAAYLDSYNTSGSLTDGGTGEYTITWDTDFSSANYAVVAMCSYSGAGTYYPQAQVKAIAAGSVTIVTGYHPTGAVDAPLLFVIAIGDQ